MLRKVSLTIFLLAMSNIFMNLAWYGHLKFKDKPILVVILASWGIALVEYCFQVPANRMGNEYLTVTQLKVIQEILSLLTFSLFAIFMFKEKFTYNQGIAFVLLIASAYFATRKS